MLDELRSRFELQGLTIAQLPESIENELIEAGQTMADTLLKEKKIIALGQGDALPVANAFIEELTDSSNIERPALPGVLLHGKAGVENVQRQLRSLGEPGDLFFVVQSSRPNTNRVANEQIVEICNLVQPMGIQSVLIGTSELPSVSAVDCTQIKLDYGSRMNYLSSVTVLSMTLAALLDHHLFGHPI